MGAARAGQPAALIGFAAVREHLAHLHQPGAVFEIRILRRRKRVFSGYFDGADAAVRALQKLRADDVVGWYVTLNPVAPALLARAHCRFEDAPQATTSDHDVPAIRHLLIDVDPVRPSGISATDEEVDHALEARDAIRQYISGLGGGDPLYSGMSGNGGSLVYRLAALPNTPASSALVKRVLEALSAEFTSDTIKVDTTVFNPARITKLIGSFARKGDSTPDRPHRRATATYWPEAQPLSAAVLDVVTAATAEWPAPPAGQTSTSERRDAPVTANTVGRSWTLAEVLDRSGVGYRTKPGRDGSTIYDLDRCLTSDAHTSGAAIFEYTSGKLAYKCLHDTCGEKLWTDAKQALRFPERPAPAPSRPAAKPESVSSAIKTEVADERKSLVFRTAREIAETPPGKRVPLPVATMTAAELLAQSFPEARPVVPGVFYEGAMLLAGRPKLGKSWLALGTAVAIACGGRALGTIAVDAGDVLYAALEDGPRRVQSRLRELLGAVQPPARLHLATEWRRLDDGGLDDLRLWLAAHPDARLVVLDTLKRVRPRDAGRLRAYDLDYESVAPLNDLAHQHNVCILIIHHCRKMDAEDPMDLISGTLGLTGAVDGAAVLRRTRGKTEATLSVAHRDVEDSELALRWDRIAAGWLLLGDAEEHRRSDERNAVLRLLHDAGEQLAPKGVAEVLGKPPGTVKKLLWTMASDGEVASDGGRYRPLVPRPAEHSGTSGNRGNPVTLPEKNEPAAVTGARTDGNPSRPVVTTVTERVVSGNRPSAVPPDRESQPVTGLPRLPLVPQTPEWRALVRINELSVNSHTADDKEVF